MPRRLKIVTKELGEVELFAIYSTNGQWEMSWRSLQTDPLAKEFTSITKEVFDQTLLGWTSPFVKMLGLAPNYSLRKLSTESKQCFQQGSCPFFEKKNCSPISAKMPWCFEPGIEDKDVRRLVAEVIKLWREKVYIIVVEE